jgi:hypothetical protein
VFSPIQLVPLKLALMVRIRPAGGLS